MADRSPIAGSRPSLRRQVVSLLSGAAGDLRRWAAVSRRRTIGVTAVIFGIMALTVYAWTLVAERVVDSAQPATLADALAALDEGRTDEALSIAKELQSRESLSPEEFGGPPFLLGMLKFQEAKAATTSDARAATFLIASKYLQEAQRRGFPAGRTAEGLFHLGESLTHAGAYAQAVPVLEEAFAHDAQNHGELEHLLALASLRSQTPDLEAAEKYTRAELEDRMLEPSQRADALLRLGEILLRRGDTQAAVELTTELPPEVRQRPAAKALHARVLMAQAEQLATRPAEAMPSASEDAANLYRQAVGMLRELQASARQRSDLSRAAMYLIGKCYAQMPGETDAALRQFARVRTLFSDTPEGIAASLAEAELLLAGNRIDEAVAAYQRTLEAVGEPNGYHSPWVPLETLRKKIQTAVEQLVATGQFDAAASLLEHLSPTFDPVHKLSQQAELYRTTGEALLGEASLKPQGESKVAHRRGRKFFRKAAQTHEEIAALQFATRDYPEQLWLAASNYLDGRAYSRAAKVLETYLNVEAVARRPQALVKLGHAYLATGRINRGIGTLSECIELHNEDAAVYEARILAARAYEKRGDVLQAEQILRDNLTAEGLTPQSQEWRESLFELGRLYYNQEKYAEATELLREYVQRYPEHSDSLQATYLVGQSYRHAAEGPLQEFETAITENDRLKHRNESRKLLSAAYDYFSEVQRTLTLKSAEGSLTPLESAILRNCYLFRGDVLYMLREYEKALDVFRNASRLYQNEPVVLDTYLQIAWCHRRLGRLQEARGAIEQARIVLSRLPPDADFAVASSMGREQWERVLTEMSQW